MLNASNLRSVCSFPNKVLLHSNLEDSRWLFWSSEIFWTNWEKWSRFATVWVPPAMDESCTLSKSKTLRNNIVLRVAAANKWYVTIFQTPNKEGACRRVLMRYANCQLLIGPLQASIRAAITSGFGREISCISTIYFWMSGSVLSTAVPCCTLIHFVLFSFFFFCSFFLSCLFMSTPCHLASRKPGVCLCDFFFFFFYCEQ